MWACPDAGWVTGERMDYLMIVMVSDTEGDRELGTKISKE